MSSLAETMIDRSDIEVLETGGDHDDQKIVLKRGAVSIVWRFFSFNKSDMNQTTFAAKVGAGGGIISNFLHHLNRTHVIEYQYMNVLIYECLRLRTASATSSDASETVKPKSIKVSLEDVFVRGTANKKKSK